MMWPHWQAIVMTTPRRRYSTKQTSTSLNRFTSRPHYLLVKWERPSPYQFNSLRTSVTPSASHVISLPPWRHCKRAPYSPIRMRSSDLVANTNLDSQRRVLALNKPSHKKERMSVQLAPNIWSRQPRAQENNRNEAKARKHSRQSVRAWISLRLATRWTKAATQPSPSSRGSGIPPKTKVKSSLTERVAPHTKRKPPTTKSLIRNQTPRQSCFTSSK